MFYVANDSGLRIADGFDTRKAAETWIQQFGAPLRNSVEEEPMMQLRPERKIPCKWCGVPTPMLNTKMCDGCWELDSRVNANPVLAFRMNDLALRVLRAAREAVRVADDARIEWDEAPAGMKAGKLLMALTGHIKGYRADIDEIHAALAVVAAIKEEPTS